MNLGLVERLMYSSVRIETELGNGTTSCGTGFFMNFLKDENRAVPAIVSNKHVIANSRVGRFHITLADEAGLPKRGAHRQFSFDRFESLWIPHPDDTIDLAVFLIAPLLHKVRLSGCVPFYAPFETSLIPSESERDNLSHMEDVIMIGYPSGIWDAVNNLPVIRRGVTATHCAIDWNGKSEFLTDIASFPGSSGSPVLLLNLGSYMDKLGNTYMGQTRVRLLGIHYAGGMHDAAGEIRILTTPTNSIPIPYTRIPNNIGVAINSNRLFEFESVIKTIISQ